MLVIWLAVFGIGGYAGYTLFFKSTGAENPYTLSSAADKEASEGEVASAETQSPIQAAVGQAVVDRSLEFTVFGIKCGEATIGSTAYSQDVASGEFCRLSLQIKNTGDQEASLPTAVQKAVDATGKEYELDIEATQFTQADLTNGDWHAQIPANTTRTGDLAFDVAAGSSIKKVILYGAKESAGIEVTL